MWNPFFVCKKNERTHYTMKKTSSYNGWWDEENKSSQIKNAVPSIYIRTHFFGSYFFLMAIKKVVHT